jgi:hypothetical protein
MINTILFKILLTVGIETLKYLRRSRNLMSPEQRAEYDKACKESFEHAGNMGSDEGALPETPGIILGDSLNPWDGKKIGGD